MSRLQRVIPHIPSKDVDATVEFLVGLFDFDVRKYSSSYTELSLGDNLIGILDSEGEPNQQSLYLRVADVDELWAKASSRVSRTKYKEPFDQEYGMREIHVVIPLYQYAVVYRKSHQLLTL